MSSDRVEIRIRPSPASPLRLRDLVAALQEVAGSDREAVAALVDLLERRVAVRAVGVESSS